MIWVYSIIKQAKSNLIQNLLHNHHKSHPQSYRLAKASESETYVLDEIFKWEKIFQAKSRKIYPDLKPTAPS